MPSFQRKFFDLSERIYLVLEWIIAIALILFGILWLTPVKEMLITHLLGEFDERRIILSGTGVVLGVIMMIVHRLGKKTDELSARISSMKLDIDQNVLHYGTLRIYEDVDREIRDRIAHHDKVEITILAYTLFSIANKFPEWKKNRELFNATFNLCHLDMDFIKTCSQIDETWADSLKTNLAVIQRFKDKNADYLKENNVEINFIPYSHIPAVHGFKLANGSFYISFAMWDENNCILPPDNITYEKVAIGDQTEHARYLRNIFNNWISAAYVSSKTL